MHPSTQHHLWPCRFGFKRVLVLVVCFGSIFAFQRIFDACACVWSLRTPARTVCRVLRKCGMNRKMPFIDAYYAHAYTHLSSCFFEPDVRTSCLRAFLVFVVGHLFRHFFLGNKNLANKETSRQITWPMFFGETTIGQEMIWPPSTTSMAPRAVTAEAEAFFFRWFRTNSVSPIGCFF